MAGMKHQSSEIGNRQFNTNVLDKPGKEGDYVSHPEDENAPDLLMDSDLDILEYISNMKVGNQGPVQKTAQLKDSPDPFNFDNFMT